jgi:hypothetical protein
MKVDIQHRPPLGGLDQIDAGVVEARHVSSPEGHFLATSSRRAT